MISALAVAHGPSNVGLWAAVAAVILDSFVTCFVGWRLNRTARKETAKAAESVKPALNEAIGQAVITLLPVLTETIKQHLDKREAEGDNTPGTIRSIGNGRESL